MALSTRTTKELSKNQFRRQCQKDFLNYLRIREWQDIYHQIRLTVREMGLPINSEKAEYQQIHTALLSGFAFSYRFKRSGETTISWRT